jgi:hypothetical protein
MSDQIGFTTTDATADLAAGDIVVRLDLAGVPVDLQGWLPSTEMVALILRGRTRDKEGRLTGAFTTDPTPDQVEDMIIDAAAETAGALPSPLPDAPGDDPDALRKGYQRVVARLAAANVELGYPSTRGGFDRYDRLLTRYKDAKATLIEAVAETGGGGGGLSVETATTLPAWTFPDAPLLPREGW